METCIKCGHEAKSELYTITKKGEKPICSDCATKLSKRTKQEM